MGTECFAQVRGSGLRVTRLNARGGYADEAIQYIASKSVSRATINEVAEGTANEVVRTDDGRPRFHLVKTGTVVRYQVDLSFLRCDPQLLSLITGVPVVENAAGDIVGFDSNTRLPVQSFALEIWSKLAGRNCSVPDVEGYGFGEGGFGEGAFGGGVSPLATQAWGYTLFPFLKGGIVTGFKFSNGLVSFNIVKASTRRNAKWGAGPYVINASGARLLEPVSGNTHWKNFITSVAPPAPTDGIVTFTDDIDGGSASVTSSDIVDGQFVITSSDSIEGGSAA